MGMTDYDVTIDITKLKPFDCKYYRHQTLLSKTACLGYCQMGEDDLSLKYCKGSDCNEYEKGDVE